MSNPLKSLYEHGQSVWLDDLSRGLITRGDLQRLIDEDGLCGLTSNPSIFRKALTEGDEYRLLLEAPESQGLEAKALYERMVVTDIQDAADAFRPLYLASNGREGYVSLEVSPKLANAVQGTLEEARRLWRAVGRENLMIKVPATQAGIRVLQQLIGEGINVNATLLFAQATYEQVALAYFSGLEERSKHGGDLSRMASVASFFISRIDTAVDVFIAKMLESYRDPVERDMLKSLLGQVAISSAKLTYQKYLELIGGNRWKELSRLGAQPQRLLWASTGTKSLNYSDVLYVEELIGAGTVNTLPPQTLESFRDHGRVHSTLESNVEEAARTLARMERLGIPFKTITDKLLVKGLKQFEDAFDATLAAIRLSARQSDHDPITFLSIQLYRELERGRHHP